MNYRENTIDQRPRILRLGIEEGARQWQEEIRAHPQPDPKAWPTNVDPRLPEPELREQLWTALRDRVFGSRLAHTVLLLALHLILYLVRGTPNVRPHQSVAIMVFCSLLYYVTTSIPARIWIRRRLRHVPEIRKKWDDQGGWRLSGVSVWDCFDTYFTDACHELFNDLRARIGMSPSTGFRLKHHKIYDLADECTALRKHVRYEPRFVDARDNLEKIVQEIQVILCAMYGRMRRAPLMDPQDRYDLDVRDQCRLNELYTEFCTAVKTRVEVDVAEMGATSTETSSEQDGVFYAVVELQTASV